MNGRTLLARAALSLAMVLSAGLALALPNYTITNLGTLGGDSGAYGLNELGDVVGRYVAADGQTHPFIWRPGHGMEDIGIDGLRLGHAWDINDGGLVCGYAGETYSGKLAYRWEHDGDTWVATWLGEVDSDYPASFARAVNNARQIVGVDVEGMSSAGFLWEAGSMQYVGPSKGIYDINEVGQAAGYRYAYDSNSHYHAVYYDGTSLIDIARASYNYDHSYACGLNDQGQVVGYVKLGSCNVPEAFLWKSDVISLIGFGRHSSGEAINNAGVAVGYGDAFGLERALAWTNESGAVDLDTLLPTGSGWALKRAYDINNAGQIVGYGLLNGEQRGFLLSPVGNDPPEADAGGPYRFLAGHSVVLDGSGSSDPDGSIVNWRWDIDGSLGPVETTAVATYTWEQLQLIFGISGSGLYDVALTVTDDLGDTGTAYATLLIVPEPATMALLGLGLLAVARRRRGA